MYIVGDGLGVSCVSVIVCMRIMYRDVVRPGREGERGRVTLVERGSERVCVCVQGNEGERVCMTVNEWG